MKKVVIHDKEFAVFIPNKKIRSVIKKIACELNRDLEGKNPLFICVLNGSFMFATELYKLITLIPSEITFVKFASYQGDQSAGHVTQLFGLNEGIKGRTVVILEDIVDTGITLDYLVKQLNAMEPAEIKIATLLLKPDAVQKKIPLDYIGLEIPNDFVIGFGLDYNGQGRNLTDLYSIINK
jgi:hypoxanthine phosphoribosyltransferase